MCKASRHEKWGKTVKIKGHAGGGGGYALMQRECCTPVTTPPPQRIAARRKDLGLRPMWDPLRSVPAQISGCALPHPRPQMQVRLWGVGRPPSR